MRTSKEIIERYTIAYEKLHGKPPYIRKRGAWIYLDNYYKPYRVSLLDGMADILEARIEEINKIQLEDPVRVKRIWKNNISNDTITLFLDELFRKCGFSEFKTERFMKNFICGGDLSDCKINENMDEFICNPENCDPINEALKKVDIIEEKYKSLKIKHNEIEHKYKNSIASVKSLIEDRNKNIKRYEELKKNSVLFSMDELEPHSSKYPYEDDDIPF